MPVIECRAAIFLEYSVHVAALPFWANPVLKSKSRLVESLRGKVYEGIRAVVNDMAVRDSRAAT